PWWKPVPAAASSLIRPVLAQPSVVASLHPVECPDLLQRLAQVPDPRDRRGLRHPLAGVLALATAAGLTGARSLAAIPDWAAADPGRWGRAGRRGHRLAGRPAAGARPTAATRDRRGRQDPAWRHPAR